MHQKSLVYFGATDSHMDFLVTHEAFWRSLVHGVLFRGDVVIPDVFLYISDRLVELVTTKSRERAFFEFCLRERAIIPAFRSDTKGSFRENLDEIRRQGIQGLHHYAPGVADALQLATRGISLRPVIWPTAALSIGYKAMLERAMLGEALPTGSPRLEQFWEDTVDIRKNGIGGAPEDEHGGLRRGGVYNSLASYLGHANPVIHESRDLWTHQPESELSETVKRLTRWVNYCYHFNQARTLHLEPSLTALDALDCEFVRHLAELDTDHARAPLLVEDLQFPSVHTLLTVDPVHLFEIRNGERGADYFSALAQWEMQPNDEYGCQVLAALRNYAAALVSVCLQHGQTYSNPGSRVRVMIPTGRSPWETLAIEGATTIILHSAGKIVEHLIRGTVPSALGWMFARVGRLAGFAYEKLPASGQHFLGPLFHGSPVRVEIHSQAVNVGAQNVPQLTDASFG